MASENWLTAIKKAKKTAIIQNDTRKVHFLFEDGRQMVEEYNMSTNVMTRRAWREKGRLGEDIGWVVEIGDPEPTPHENTETYNIKESAGAPIVSRRATRINLEWRIRNLSHPKDVYSVTVDDNVITVRTSNKKYFKKLHVPDLERIGLKMEQERISFTHQHNTLIITYKKPPALLEFEKMIFKEIMNVKTNREGDVQCPTN